MAYDYSDAPPPRDMELIPNGTIATAQMRIRPGGVGEDGMLKRAKDGLSEHLDLEFVLLDGPYAKRKFWERLTMAGTTSGHESSANTNRGTLKTILDSALNLDPNDKTPQARTQRTVGIKAFDGLNFVARIGIEKGKSKTNGSGENWPDRNFLAGAITRDRKEWTGPVQQTRPFGGTPPASASEASPASTSAPITKPGWAT